MLNVENSWFYKHYCFIENMKWKMFPLWLKTGILIFPVLIILSLLLGFFGGNNLLWLVVPSIIFEKLFESCCTFIDDSLFLNVIFDLIFWFLIGAAVGKVIELRKVE